MNAIFVYDLKKKRINEGMRELEFTWLKCFELNSFGIHLTL